MSSIKRVNDAPPPLKDQPWTVKNGKVLALTGEWWSPLELLRAVQRHIHKAPDSYQQHETVRRPAASACGTTACIAGWAVLLTTGHETCFGRTVGAFLCGLKGLNNYAWPWLFEAHWPHNTPHGAALRAAKTPKERVAAADLAIEAFVKEYKLES